MLIDHIDYTGVNAPDASHLTPGSGRVAAVAAVLSGHAAGGRRLRAHRAVRHRDGDFILDDDAVAPLQNRNTDLESTGLTEQTIGNGAVDVGLEEGQVTLTLPIRPYGNAPAYFGDDNLQPIVAVGAAIPHNPDDPNAVPTSVTAKLSFAGLAGGEVSFSTAGYTRTQLDEPVRFVVAGPDLTLYLRSGRYDYDMELTASFGSEEIVRTIRGKTEVVNRVGKDFGVDEFGDRWWVPGLDRLVPGDEINSPFDNHTDPAEYESGQRTRHISRLGAEGALVESGVSLIRGDATSAWYETAVKGAPITPGAVFSGSTDWALGKQSGGYRYSDGALVDAVETATWTAPIEAQKTYQIFVNWKPGEDRASTAAYTVSGAVEIGSTETSKTTLVNQRFRPGELDFDGDESWRSLGFYTSETAGDITVELSTRYRSEDDFEWVFTDGLVVAGGVMLYEDWTFGSAEGSYNAFEYRDVPTTVVDGYDEARIDGYFTRYHDSADIPTNDDGIFTLANKHGGRYEFDHRGLLKKHVDRNNNATQYSYDSNGALASIVDSRGLTTTYTIGDFLGSIQDFAGLQYDFTISGDGQLTNIIEPATGQAGSARPTYQFVYGGPDGRLSQVTNGRGDVTTVNYGAGGRVASVVNGDLESWSIAPQIVDGLGGTLRSASTDALIGNREVPAAGGLQEARAVYTDPRGNDWTYQVDRYGLMTGRANPLGDVWRWERRDDGLPEFYYQPPGGGGTLAFADEIETSYSHDGRGNRTQVTTDQSGLGGGGAITESWSYHPDFSVPLSATDGRGNVTSFVLDAFGNTEWIHAPESVSTHFQYTPPAGDHSPEAAGAGLPGGLVTVVTDPRGYLTKTDYYDKSAGDAAHLQGLPKKVRAGLGAGDVEYQVDPGDGNVVTVNAAITHFTYDANRYQHLVTQQMGGLDSGVPVDAPDRVSEYVHDNLGRLVKLYSPAAVHVNPDGSLTAQVRSYVETHYDGQGLVTQTTDGLLEGGGGAGRTTSFEYDGMLRPTLVTRPAAAQVEGPAAPTTQTQYDENGNVRFVTDALGRVVEYQYDERNLKTIEILPDPGTGDHGQSITKFAYDTLGNLASVKDPLHLEIAVGAGFAVLEDRETTYEYDRLHRKTREEFCRRRACMSTTSISSPSRRTSRMRRRTSFTSGTTRAI